MPYCGPTTLIEYIASARRTCWGYKAVIITRRHAPGGAHFDTTEIVSRTLPSRDLARAFATRRIERLPTHRDRIAARKETTP